VSAETERFAEVAALIGRRLNTAVKDVIPPEAHAHLLNAQRELLTAIFLIYEQQAGARRPTTRAPRGRAQTARKPRVQRIEIDE
jgi:hypothetical protein